MFIVSSVCFSSELKAAAHKRGSYYDDHMNTNVNAEVRVGRLPQETFPHLSYRWPLTFDDTDMEKKKINYPSK